MAETNSPAKDDVLRQFETMKGFELAARDLYTQIAASADIGPAKVKTAFKSLADDEQRHADLAQEIIDIITDAL